MASTTTTTTSTPESIDLGNNIFLYPPASSTTSHASLETPGGPPPPPALIILCTWLGGASPPRIDKYVTGYRARFPDASLLLIRTVFLDLSVRSFASLRARLRPARAAAAAILDRSPRSSSGPGRLPPRDVLLHVFSHGGCNQALQLLAAAPEGAGAERDRRAAAALRGRLALLVMDSCPGDASFAHAYQAALYSLPGERRRPLTRALGAPFVGAAVGVIHGLQSAGAMRSVRELRRELLDPAVFGNVPHRLYLYSEGDAVVAAEDVRAHAVEARQRLGCRVSEVVFREAGHCALVTEDKGKYWDAIQEAWDGGEVIERGWVGEKARL